MGPDDLRTVGRRVKRRRAALDADVELLHRLVRDARASGMSLRKIAAESGLSYGRIFQVTKEND